MQRFEGKVAMVTGAARGLGRVTALAFTREGARVALADIDEAGGRETLDLIRAAGGEGLFLLADMRVESEVETFVAKTVESFGRLDCAVNNAGVVRFAPIVEDTEAGQLFPIGRMGKAEELTEAVLFLYSEKARFIVGHLLVIDGGWIAR